MEVVHYNHPMAVLKNIDLDTIGSWETIPGGKLLAQPFGAYTNRTENHSILKSLIFAAVVEITNAIGVSVCAPRRSPTANRNPTAFLIHN
jgi:Zn-dependent M28 family amino/carboxypeptidase